jgi:hypothetical protein
MVYSDTSAKQPDASYILYNLSNPTRANGIKYQPGTTQHFPRLVVEVAVEN